VQAKAVLVFMLLFIAFILLCVPDLVEYREAPIQVFDRRLNQFIAYVFGEGWLSQLWLTSLIVGPAIRFTRARIVEKKVLTYLLGFLVIVSLVWVFFSFIFGQPMKALG